MEISDYLLLKNIFFLTKVLYIYCRKFVKKKKAVNRKEVSLVLDPFCMHLSIIFFYVCVLLIFFWLDKTVHGILIRTDTTLDLSHKAEKLCPWHFGTYFVCLVMSFQVSKWSTLPLFVMASLKSLSEHTTTPFCGHV